MRIVCLGICIISKHLSYTHSILKWTWFSFYTFCSLNYFNLYVDDTKRILVNPIQAMIEVRICAYYVKNRLDL